jgi:hypothetical protein
MRRKPLPHLDPGLIAFLQALRSNPMGDTPSAVVCLSKPESAWSVFQNLRRAPRRRIVLVTTVKWGSEGARGEGTRVPGFPIAAPNQRHPRVLYEIGGEQGVVHAEILEHVIGSRCRRLTDVPAGKAVFFEQNGAAVRGVLLDNRGEGASG